MIHMNKQFLQFFARIISLVILCLAVSASAFAYPSGAPAGYTGSPGDGHHCVSCHGGSAATVTAWITSNIPAAGYTGGANYTITVTVSGTGKKGFEVSPQNASGTQLGVLAAGSGSHLIGGTKYVTHSSAGSSSSTASWNFTWTAPVSGTGSVTFYGAFTVGKSNTKLSTLVVNENAVIPLTANATATPSVVCAGQTVQLNVVPDGGSGSYTYSWTSVPAGFTSNIQNPVDTPVVSAQYFVQVSDGVSTADASTSATVNQPATAAAGNDTTVSFETSQIPLNGIASSYSGVLWTTTGTGTFTAASSLAGNYLPSVADKTGGTVTLTLTASPVTPCPSPAADSRIIHFDFPIGVSEGQGFQAGLSISPNPSTGLFNLRVSGMGNLNTTITISEITGRIIVNQTMEPSVNQDVRFDLTAYPRGLYLIKIQSDTQSLVRKLLLN